MKIAIATVEKDVKSEISNRGGRAPYYLIFEDKELSETILNPFQSGGGGAGVGVAKMLADLKVDAVVVAKIGEKMEDSLKEKGIEFYEREGIAEEVMEEIFSSKK